MTAHQLQTVSTDLIPITEAEMPKAASLLKRLHLAWRETPKGQKIRHGMSSTQLRATISLLRRLEANGTPTEMGRVIERMLRIYYPPGKDIPESVKEDWLYVLADQPLASIYECYQRQIRSPAEWAPKPGQFLQSVHSHARNVQRIREKLEKAEAET